MGWSQPVLRGIITAARPWDLRNPEGLRGPPRPAFWPRPGPGPTHPASGPAPSPGPAPGPLASRVAGPLPPARQAQLTAPVHSGPPCAYRAAQGLQVAGQGLQLAPVVVGLVLGLAEQLAVAGSSVCQVRKLVGEDPMLRGGLRMHERTWGAVWARGKHGLWEIREVGRTPGLSRSPRTLSRGGIIPSDCDPWTEPGQVYGLMNSVCQTESQIFCTGSST